MMGLFVSRYRWAPETVTFFQNSLVGRLLTRVEESTVVRFQCYSCKSARCHWRNVPSLRTSKQHPKEKNAHTEILYKLERWTISMPKWKEIKKQFQEIFFFCFFDCDRKCSHPKPEPGPFRSFELNGCCCVCVCFFYAFFCFQHFIPCAFDSTLVAHFNLYSMC